MLDLPPQSDPSLGSHPRSPESGHPNGIFPQPSSRLFEVTPVVRC